MKKTLIMLLLFPCIIKAAEYTDFKECEGVDWKNEVKRQVNIETTPKTITEAKIDNVVLESVRFETNKNDSDTSPKQIKKVEANKGFIYVLLIIPFLIVIKIILLLSKLYKDYKKRVNV